MSPLGWVTAVVLGIAVGRIISAILLDRLRVAEREDFYKEFHR